MICLKASTAAGKIKREYIEDVINDCKLIFNAAFADQFFHDDNLKIAFCTSADQASVFEEFCGKYFPLYLDKNYSRTDYFAAQAMTNVPENICGILICLDTPDEGEIWYQIILHEMSHIFCITNELDGENFQDKCTKEKTGGDVHYYFSTVGYAVWREFIADYIAIPITPLMKPISLVNLRENVRKLDEGVNRANPECSQDCSQILSYIFTYPKIKNARDVKSVFRILKKNRIFATKERSQDYYPIIEAIFVQLKQEKYWSITNKFMERIGMTYCALVNW